MNGARPLALVTGGLHRLGAVLATRLGAAGYDLALHHRSGGDADEPLRSFLASDRVTHGCFAADLADAAAADQLFDAVVARFGRAPTLLVNNASLFGAGGWADADPTEMSRHFAVNAIAPIQLAGRLAAAHAVDADADADADAAADAVIINILDQRVRNPVPDQFAYSLSKQALWQATRTMAVAMAPRVRVNAIAPGLTIPTADYADGQMARLAAEMPLGRLPQPDDIADALMYLAGARAVTGQTIFVDGGANLKSFARDFVML